MQWYAMTGVVDGVHYQKAFQAPSLREAEAIFTELVFRNIPAIDYPEMTPEMGLEAVRDDYCAPWIVSMVRSNDEIELIGGAAPWM